MKGVIFKLFESFISETFGHVVYEEILTSTPLATEGPFVGPENYPDEDLFALFSAAFSRLHIPRPLALQSFGVFLFERLSLALPAAANSSGDLRSFLKTVDSLIQLEIQKLFPDAVATLFEYTETSPTSLALRYTSERGLCDLALGLIQGAADSFGETVTIEETLCTKKGVECCEFHIEFANPPIAAN